MKNLAIAIGTLALAAPLAMAQTSTWKIDPAHSEVDFKIRHLGISNVNGRFGHVAGTIVFDEANISNSKVDATIDITAIATGEAARDNHLKSPDFFDVAKFPTASFTSTKAWKDGSTLKVAGNFTLHGVTKAIVLDVDGPTKPITGMDSKPHTGFEATTTINRQDYGLTFNATAGGEAVVGNDVKLTIELDAVKQ